MDTLNSMDNNRRCFRMIHGVLVERTVGTVVPILKTTQEGVRNFFILTLYCQMNFWSDVLIKILDSNSHEWFARPV